MGYANEGRQDDTYRVTDRPKPTRKSLKELIARGVVKAWNKRWAEEETCRQTRMWFPQIRPDMSAWLLTSGRRALNELILIITGHNFWNRHNWLVDKERLRRREIEEEQLAPPYCDLCLSDRPRVYTQMGLEAQGLGEYLQTTWHLFAECEALATTRFEVLGQCFGTQLATVKRRKILRYIRQAKLSVFPSDQEEVMAIDRSQLLT